MRPAERIAGVRQIAGVGDIDGVGENRPVPDPAQTLLVRSVGVPEK